MKLTLTVFIAPDKMARANNAKELLYALASLLNEDAYAFVETENVELETACY